MRFTNYAEILAAHQGWASSSDSWLLRFAFILGRIALIFQNPLFFTSFFCIFANEKYEI